MKIVFLVDGTTRIILTESYWGNSVRDKLREMGHIVQQTTQVLDPDIRDDAELLRVGKLLDSTGL